MLRKPLWSLTATVSLLACSGGTDPSIKPCPGGGGMPVNLGLFEYVSLDLGANEGCAMFPATGSAAEYLVVPQLATGTPGQKSAFQLGGDTIRPVVLAPPVARTGIASASSAERFHTFLRMGDERRSWGYMPERGTAPQASPAVPPAPGSLRTFMVCAKVDCSRFDRVVARVRVVKTKVAIYVDTLAPAPGLDSTALDSIANVFDQRLYGVDTAAFGVESDIDNNQVVLVLMTNVVNKLVTNTECLQSGFVAGFFFGADLDPAFQSDPRSNKGEIFYSVVADPSGTLSCLHSVQAIQAFLPITFVHEFQHMISFNQHVLVRGGGGEVLWLNEGFSHYAEELAGRSYAASPDAQIVDCTVGTTECLFYGGSGSGNLLNAYTYLDSTQGHFLLPTAGLGTIAERGATWLFVRYLVDHYASASTSTAWNALTRSLVGTANTGAQNIAAVTGEPFATTVSRWALANYMTDNGAAPAELQYSSWALHAVFSSLHTQRPSRFPNTYPLIPEVSVGRDLDRSDTLRAGSGVYVRATQPGGDPGFTLHLTTPTGALINPSYVPRLNVIRLQ